MPCSFETDVLSAPVTCSSILPLSDAGRADMFATYAIECD